MIKIRLNNHIIGSATLWLVILTSFYYPLAASVITVFNLPSTPVNILIRGLCTLLALYLIFLWCFNKKTNFQFSFAIWFLILFWTFYSLRILFDLSRGVHFSDYSNTYIYGFTFGNILVPIFAIIFWGKYIDISKIPEIFFYFFILVDLSILAVLLYQGNGIDINAFLQRASIQNNDNQNAGGAVLNSITLGFYGELLAIISLFQLSFSKKKILGFFSLLLGFLIVMLGASRGPFLGLIITSLVILILKFRVSKAKTLFVIKFLSVAIIIYLVIKNTIAKSFSIDDFYIFDRIFQFFEERQNNVEEARDVIYASAWQDFLSSPIIGKQFVSTLDNFYPHNFFLELLMATGIVGAIIFSCFYINLIKILYNLFQQKDNNAFFLLIIYIPVALTGLTSGSLFQSVDFWLLTTLILALKSKPSLNNLHL